MLVVVIVQVAPLDIFNMLSCLFSRSYVDHKNLVKSKIAVSANLRISRVELIASEIPECCKAAAFQPLLLGLSGQLPP